MKAFLQSIRLLIVLTIMVGVIYPLVVTGLARIFFPRYASGSLLMYGGHTVGSALIAQRFGSNKYFWPRPSAGDDGTNFATMPSAASNLGPTSSNLSAAVRERATAFRAANKLPADAPVPADMLFASGSGLDPHISPESARLQIDRVALARNFTAEQRRKLAALVERSIEPPQLNFMGEPRVNVLMLNLALDQLK